MAGLPATTGMSRKTIPVIRHQEIPMKFVDSIVIAIRSLFANKLRSSLTMLGVIIGVGSVITLMSVGEGAQAQITSTLEDLGTNPLSVVSQTPGVGGLATLQAATP